MADPELPVSDVHRKGAEPSLIERFGIEGLYGYRSIYLESKYAATILIAKNGTGKTTLLGALDAFLRMQLGRLRNLEFAELHCKLRGEDSELILSHTDVIDFLQVPTEGELIRLASRANVDPASLFNFLVEEWNPKEEYQGYPHDNKVFSSLIAGFDYDHRETLAAMVKARISLMERQPTVSNIFSRLEKTLAGCEVVYLPTYRRVELPLRGDTREVPHRRKRPRFDVAAGSLFTGEIQFGLSDISDRLSQLNQQILLDFEQWLPEN